MTNPSFSFSAPVSYQSQNDDSILEFSSGGVSGSFSWRGSSRDWIGTYQLQQVRDSYHLELSYNYARETTYLVTFLYHEENTLISFRLTDPHGRITEFTRI